jgi:threonine/homoserine/homoserine lactone efflux protein
LFMAIGVAMSDSLYIFISYSGLSQIADNMQFKFYLGLLGALIMVGFGFSSIFRPVPRKGLKRYEVDSNSYLRKTVKGFMLNSLNPFVLLFWIGVAGLVTVEMHFNFDQASLFYIGVISVVLSMDITKSFLANRLRMFITPHFMKIMNRGVGIMLILFGIRLFYYALELKQMI